MQWITLADAKVMWQHSMFPETQQAFLIFTTVTIKAKK